MQAVSKLGEEAEPCESGRPCARTPNALHVYGNGPCPCQAVPLEWQKKMRTKAKSSKKESPVFSGDTCSGIMMERVHSDLAGYKDRIDKRDKPNDVTFKHAVFMQILFAYHAAFHEVGFVHADILADNLALKCMTTW